MIDLAMSTLGFGDLTRGGLTQRRRGAEWGYKLKVGQAVRERQFAAGVAAYPSSMLLKSECVRAGIDNIPTPANNETNEMQEVAEVDLKATIPNWVRIGSIVVFALSFVIGMVLVSWY